MSLTRPISTLGKRTYGKRRIILFLFIGLGMGGAGGFLLGRNMPLSTSPSSSTPNECLNQQNPNSGISSPSAVTSVEGTGQPKGPAILGIPDEWKDLRYINLEISGSLYATLATRLYGRELDVLNAQLGRVLVWWIDLQRDVQRGDRVQALYKPTHDATEYQLLAASYMIAAQNTTHEAYYFKSRGARYGHYYDSEGAEVELRLENSPLVEYEQITELMDMTGRRHRGIDFKADIGTPVILPFQSQILRVNWSTRRNGNCLEVRYVDSGTRVMFLHLDDVLPVARPGRIVDAGTIVAHSGNTGHSTAPHLHYQLHSQSGQLLNPFKVQPTKRMKLQDKDLEEFMTRREQLKQLLTNGIPAPESAPSPSESNVSKATSK